MEALTIAPTLAVAIAIKWSAFATLILVDKDVLIEQSCMLAMLTNIHLVKEPADKGT